jgi:uncharacterized protein (DUF2062 family)
MAWLIRANIIASAIGTAVGNPWTFPFIWWWVYNLGAWIIGIEPVDKISIEFTVEGFSSETMVLFVTMLVGGIATGAVVWLAVYFPLFYLVEKYQRRRRARREAKARRRREIDAPPTESGSPT